MNELSHSADNFDILSEAESCQKIRDYRRSLTFPQLRPSVMNATRRFRYFFDVLSIGRSPIITFYDSSELSHSAGTVCIVSETGNPAKIFEIEGEVSHSHSSGRVL